MGLKYNKQTDEKQILKLKSRIIGIEWLVGMAYAGLPAPFTVITELVGYGAPMKLVCKNAQGKKLLSQRVTVTNSVYEGKISIPDSLQTGDFVFLEADLPKLSLSASSMQIPVRSPVKVTELKWDATETERGKIVTLSARFDEIPEGERVAFCIYEYDKDGYNEIISEVSAPVRKGSATTAWEFSYPGDTSKIPTERELQAYGSSYSLPRFFFTVTHNGYSLGEGKRSNLLSFKDWLRLRVNCPSQILEIGVDTMLEFADGKKMKVKTPLSGEINYDEISPGPCTVEFINEVPPEESEQ